MINARDEEMYLATGFIGNVVMLLYSFEQSFRKLLMTFGTLSEFPVWSSNCFVLLFSGNDVIVRM